MTARYAEWTCHMADASARLGGLQIVPRAEPLPSSYSYGTVTFAV
jgi:hypothetical protein